MATELKCRVVTCSNRQRTKFVMCTTCWNKLPIALKESVRQGTAKGSHTLRAVPSSSWVEGATKHVGKIRITFATFFQKNDKKKPNFNQKAATK